MMLGSVSIFSPLLYQLSYLPELVSLARATSTPEFLKKPLDNSMQQRTEGEEITSHTDTNAGSSGKRVADRLGRQRHLRTISPLDWTRFRTRAGNDLTSPYTLKMLIILIRRRFKRACKVGRRENSMRFGSGFRVAIANSKRPAKASLAALQDNVHPFVRLRLIEHLNVDEIAVKVGVVVASGEWRLLRTRAAHR